MEAYHTLSKACFDCPFNQTDCFRPHCVPADGFEKSILTVNRMLPGPAIQVQLHAKKKLKLNIDAKLRLLLCENFYYKFYAQLRFLHCIKAKLACSV